MPSGEQVAFQPALTEMLAEDLHDPAIGSQVLVNRKRFRQPGLAGDVVHRAEPVGRRLVGTHDPEVVRVLTNDVAQERAQHLGGFVKPCAGLFNLDRVVSEIGQSEFLQDLATVRVRVGAHPTLPFGRQCAELGL